MFFFGAEMAATLKIACAQFNPRLGDFSTNVAQLIEAAKTAQAAGAQVLVASELALCGYPPEDLLLRPDFYRAADAALEKLQQAVPEMALVVGHPVSVNGLNYNAASVLYQGECCARYYKNHLPNSEVFDEKRYFTEGQQACVVELFGVRCGLLICEDMWHVAPAQQTRAAGAELLLVLNASPLHLGKTSERQNVARQRVGETGVPLVYVNMVGGQDELVFDGGSFALNEDGTEALRLPQFESAIGVVTFADGKLVGAGNAVQPMSIEAEAYQALVLGVRDYIGKNGFPGAIIGLSGGIDSALTLCVAVDALGADKVRAVMMASPYTAQMSLDDSRQLIEALSVRYDEIPIASAMSVYENLLAPQFSGLPADTTEENLQARIRGTILMALSNKTGSLVLTTGNKSETAVGYATLYGDMAGGFAVIKDVYKTLVWRLSRYRNTLSPVIPDNIITRPPSAELRPDQCDQDSLPPYEILDAIVQGYMEDERSPRELIASGLPEDAVRRVVRLLRIAEYKRRQAPPGIRITKRAFGKDWRYPITNRYSDEF